MLMNLVMLEYHNARLSTFDPVCQNASVTYTLIISVLGMYCQVDVPNSVTDLY